MKTLLRSVVAFTVLAGLCSACTPPEDEVHPKRRSSRSDNLKRYIPKAQELRAMAAARSKPVVDEPLLPVSALDEFLPQTPDTRVSAAITARQTALRDAVREACARHAAEKISALLNQFETDALHAAQTAQKPEELSAGLTELNARYSQELAELGREEEKRGWERVNPEQNRLSRQELKDVLASALAELERDYGEPCARKSAPVLQRAADDYWLVLSSDKNLENLNAELAAVGTRADAELAKIIQEYGDPALSFSPENAASLKARVISAHQKVEQKFEKLYGKEAVLQTRNLFERYLNGLDALCAEKGRLSELSERLEALNAVYRADMTELQVRLNEELEQKLLAARTARG